MFESLHQRLYLESIKAGRMVYIDEICDLKKMSIGQLSPSFVSKVARPWISVTQTYYPETAKRISFLNPPSILSVAWSIVAKMVSKSTVEKVQLFPNFEGTTQDFVEMHHKNS